MLDADAVRKLSLVVSSLNVGVLAIGDLEEKHLTFNSNLDQMMGFANNELKGRKLSLLIGADPDQDDAHFLTFLDQVKDGGLVYPQNMTSVNFICKDGEEKEFKCLVEFVYDANFTSFFILLIDEGSDTFDELKKTYVRVQKILLPGGKAGAAFRIFAFRASNLFSKVFTGASLTALLGLALTNTNGLVAAWKSFGATKVYDNTKLSDSQITDYAAKDSALNPMLVRIRDELHIIEPAIEAVAFYRIQNFPSFGSTNESFTAIAKFGSDSNDQNGRETFFEDQRLTLAQLNKLESLECIWIENLGYYPERGQVSDKMFGGFICPTVYVNSSSAAGIPKFDLSTLLVASINSDYEIGGKKFDHTSYRGREIELSLKKRSPSVQPLSRKE